MSFESQFMDIIREKSPSAYLVAGDLCADHSFEFLQKACVTFGNMVKFWRSDVLFSVAHEGADWAEDEAKHEAYAWNGISMVSCDTVIEIPTEVVICPYCNACLSARATAWSIGRCDMWAADDVELECGAEQQCKTEKEWIEYNELHSHMPYMNWLPAKERADKWIARRIRFFANEFEEIAQSA